MFRRTVISLLVAAALVAPPAASAATEWGPPLSAVTPASRAAYDVAQAGPAATDPTSGDVQTGFDWADAAIGAAAAFALSAAAATLVLVRLPRRRGEAPA